MAKFTRFEDLDDPKAFGEIVTAHFTTAWDQITGAIKATPTVSKDRVSWAFERYQNNLKAFRLRVPSQNPDHYKRAACFLDALVQAQVIEEVEFDQQRCDELESGLAFGMSYDDMQYELRGLKLFEFFGNNGNEGMAFDLAFRCCQTYETENKRYGAHFFESMIRHLGDSDGSISGLYLIFKAYWDAS
jgi:hypothetical protein